MKTKVLIVGSNPSVKSPDLSPFHGSTRSRMVIDQWFDGIDAEIHFMNLIDETRPGNKPLSRSEILSIIPPVFLQLQKYKDYKIVTVGKSAELALSIIGINFLPMPHPSGRNRLLNDRSYVEEKIKTLRVYLSVS